MRDWTEAINKVLAGEIIFVRVPLIEIAQQRQDLHKSILAKTAIPIQIDTLIDNKPERTGFGLRKFGTPYVRDRVKAL